MTCYQKNNTLLFKVVMNNSREKEFLRKKKQLIYKYNSFLDKYSQRSNYKISLINPANLNLTSEEIPKHYESLLNLGPKFCLRRKTCPLRT